MESNKIVDRIKKLFSRANGRGATPNEIDNCLQLANNLITKYQITEMQLNMHSSDEYAYKDVTVKYIPVGKRLRLWYNCLTVAVQKKLGNVDVCLYGTNFRVVGEEEDVDAFINILEMWRNIIVAQTESLYRSANQGAGMEYAHGFVAGMIQAFRESKLSQEFTSTELVQLNTVNSTKLANARTHLAKVLNSKSGEVRQSKRYSSNDTAYSKGFEDGKNSGFAETQKALN